MAAIAGPGSGVGGGGSPYGSPVARDGQTNVGPRHLKRNASLAALDSSPGTAGSPDVEGSEDGAHGEERKKQPVKRACNECRQQKVSHGQTARLRSNLAFVPSHGLS